jgi:hypothetical protein
MNSVFEELIRNTNKQSYDYYLKSEMMEERKQIKKGVEFEKELFANFRNKLENGELPWTVGKVSQDMLEWANNELNKGNVAAVDGTNMFPMDLISGMFCQVGVGGISYTSDAPSINVQSITSHIENEETAGKYFGKLMFGNEKKITKLDIQSAMAYWEVDHCLHRQEKWVFKDGPLLPRNLLDFEVAIDLLNQDKKKLKSVFGIIKGSKSVKYRILGRFLKKGEYAIIERSSDFFKEIMNIPQRGFLRKTKSFVDDFATSVYRGVYKSGLKSYVFEIHEDYFDKGIALIMADSMRNPRGLPFLIDLIDSKLSDLFENNIYRERMYNFLLEEGELMENIDERELRNW